MMSHYGLFSLTETLSLHHVVTPDPSLTIRVVKVTFPVIRFDYWVTRCVVVEHILPL